MNGRGRNIDNIVIERFFLKESDLLKQTASLDKRTLKHINIYISDYQSIKEIKVGVEKYINKYNFKRLYVAIGYQKPMNMYIEFLKNMG